MTETIGLGLVAGGAIVVAATLAVRNLRLRREVVAINADLTSLLTHDSELGQEVEALKKLIQEMGPAYLDAQWRWNLPIPEGLREHVGYPTSEERSQRLVEGVPGIGRLSDGKRAAWWSSSLPEGESLTPPRLVAG